MAEVKRSAMILGRRALVVAALAAGVHGCGNPTPVAKNEVLSSAQAGVSAQPAVPEVAPADQRECDQAKEAAVAARTEYDRDYERRNPGAVSASLSPSELTSCRLNAAGAYLGKWGGQRWRFVPKSGARYSRNPRQVWVGDNEGLDDLSWFSEWRADGASVTKNEELNLGLRDARVIYG